MEFNLTSHKRWCSLVNQHPSQSRHLDGDRSRSRFIAETINGVSLRTNQGRAVAFDVDPESLERIGQAFPEWTIDIFPSTVSQFRASEPLDEVADLLVLGGHHSGTPSAGLCRVLRTRFGCADTPLLVLVPPDTQSQVEAFLDAGANSCLILPIQVQELVDVFVRARAGNRPGHHTGKFDEAQQNDLWQDDGGEG